MRFTLLFPLLACSALPVQAQNPWPTTRWVAHCDDSGLEAAQCYPANPASPAAAVTRQLERVSVWLEGLGFRAPEVYRDGRPPQVEPFPYIVTLGGDEVTVENRVVHGYYERNRPGGSIVVDATHFFQMGNEWNVTATPAHELFHAVQGAYTFFSGTDEGSEALDWSWIVEGTAAAAEGQWVVQTEGAYGEPVWPYDIPKYDYPLHRPKDYREEGSLSAYRRGHFWWRLGDVLMDSYGVGTENPIQYLAHLFEHMHAGDDLDAVDGALREFEPRGLYELFPRFVARFANSPQVVEEVTSVALALEDERSYRDAGATVEPVAIRHYTVVVDVPEGEEAGLEVRLADDHPDLHLIVDQKRYDAADPLVPDAGRNSAFVRIAGGGRDTLRVRVANVAEYAPESEQRTYTIEMELVRAHVSFTEGPAGTYDVDGVPGFSVFTGSGPHPDACTFTLMLPSSENDLVTLAGILPRPLGPAGFPIVPNADAVGSVGIQVSPACHRTGVDCSAGLPRSTNYSGSFGISEITDETVTGRFQAFSRGDEVNASGRFVARLRGVVFDLPPDHPCRPQ